MVDMTLAGTTRRRCLYGLGSHTPLLLLGLLLGAVAAPLDEWQRSPNQKLVTTEPYIRAQIAEPGAWGLEGDPVIARIPHHTTETLRHAPKADWLVLIRLSGEVEVLGNRTAMHAQFWHQLDYCQSMGDGGISISNTRWRKVKPQRGGWVNLENTTPPSEQWAVFVRPKARTVTVEGVGTPPESLTTFWRTAINWLPDCLVCESCPRV